MPSRAQEFRTDAPPDSDAIPGYAGLHTPDCACSATAVAELRAVGASVYGLGARLPDCRQEMAARLHLTYPVLSDADLKLTRALRLPTFQYGEWTLLHRLCLIVRGTTIAHVIYPVFPSNADAPAAVAWLKER